MKSYDTTGSLLGQMTVAGHATRRKIWDRAFTTAALKSYEPLLDSRVAELVENLTSRCGQVVDLALWVSLLTLDFMGDFAYGGAFNNMKDGADSSGMRSITAGAALISEALGTIPWVRPFVLTLPQTQAKVLNDASLGVAERRKAKGASARDLFYYLVSFLPLALL
jgi:cytochrome P450